MSDSQSEMDAYYERSRRPLISMPNSRLGKLGCWALIVAWFMILMLPCGMFYLATGNAFTLQHASVPEPQEHPLLRVQLIMEIDNRGLQIARSSIQQSSATNLCVSSQVNYLLWASDGEDLDVAFCQCYDRETADDNWQFVGTQTAGRCE